MPKFDIEVIPPATRILKELDRLRIKLARVTEENATLKATVAKLTDDLRTRLSVEQWELQVTRHTHELEGWKAKHQTLQAVSFRKEHDALQREVIGLHSQVEVYQLKILGFEKQSFIKQRKSKLLQTDVISGVVSFLDFKSLTKLARTSKSALMALGTQVGTWKAILANAVEVNLSSTAVEGTLWTEDLELKGLIDK